jgi:hypothetical protein
MYIHTYIHIYMHYVCESIRYVYVQIYPYKCAYIHVPQMHK